MQGRKKSPLIKGVKITPCLETIYKTQMAFLCLLVLASEEKQSGLTKGPHNSFFEIKTTAES